MTNAKSKSGAAAQGSRRSSRLGHASNVPASPEPVAQTASRKRGRAPAAPCNADQELKEQLHVPTAAAEPVAEPVTKRPRGRPRNSAAAPPAEAATAPSAQALEPQAAACEQVQEQPEPKLRTARNTRAHKARAAAAADPAQASCQDLGSGASAGGERTEAAATAHTSHQLELQAAAAALSTSPCRQQQPGASPSKAPVPAASVRSPVRSPVRPAPSPAKAAAAPAASPSKAAPHSKAASPLAARAPAAHPAPAATAATSAPTAAAPPQQPPAPPRAPAASPAPPISSALPIPAAAATTTNAAAPSAAAQQLDLQALAEIRKLMQPGMHAAARAGAGASTEAAADAGAGARVDGASAVGAAASCSSTSSSDEPAARGAQFKELRGVIAGCCLAGTGGAVYVSGLPGTGKTHTVARVLASLPCLAHEINTGTYVHPAGAPAPAASCSGHVALCTAAVNCMALDDPALLYGRLQEELLRAAAEQQGPGRPSTSCAPAASGPSATSTEAFNCLVDALRKLSQPTHVTVRRQQPAAPQQPQQQEPEEPAPKRHRGGGKGSAAAKRGRGAKGGKGAAGEGEGEACGEEVVPLRRVFVVVLDEVDRLLRKRGGEEELVRLFQMPAVHGLPLVLLSVANSLDLTERMMPLLRARGTSPKHMVFTAYSRLQVRSILEARLAGHPCGPGLFDGAALDMVAKAVSGSSGDLRQALKVGAGSGSSGDLRQALKACRTALDVLGEQLRAQAAAPPAPAAQAPKRPGVGIREMHAALQRLSTTGAASAVSAKIKALPPQQQLVLLALATAVGAKASAAEGGCGAGFGGQQQQQLFTGARPQFVDGVAFREIGNVRPAGQASNPGGCFGEDKSGAANSAAGAPSATPSKGAARGGTSASGALTPHTGSRARGAGGPGGATPSSRTPASSILAGDAGLALLLTDVYEQYRVLCRTLDIPSMSYSAFRTEAVMALDCDGLVRLAEGRTPAAARMKLVVMARDVSAALADNVMFKRLLGARAPAPAPGPGPAPVPGIGSEGAAAGAVLAR